MKEYLLSFGMQRLEQTGKSYNVGATTVKARKKTNNKWYETQDSISYWEDFQKPKAMWKIIGCNINFSFDNDAMICNNAVNIITGNEELILQFVGIMNSKLFDWYLKLTTEAEVQGGGIQLYVTTLEKTLVKLNFSGILSHTVRERVKGNLSDFDVDEAVFNAYGLTSEERYFILSNQKVNRKA